MLTEKILEDLVILSDCCHPNIIHHKEEVHLALLHKNQAYFLTDGKICMQANMGLSHQKFGWENELSPYNRNTSNYYNVVAKHAKYYDFEPQGELSVEAIKSERYMTPYSPRFYFGDKVEEFVKQRSTITHTIIQNLVVTNWAIKVVNVANTGFYGVILDIYEYTKAKEAFFQVQNIEMVLFVRAVKIFLEKLRIDEIKRRASPHNDQLKGSMCYYMKNIKGSTYSSNRSPFVYADKQGKFLKSVNNPDQTLNFVALGDIEGTHRFIRPLTNVSIQSELQKKHINFEKLSYLVAKRKDGKIQIDLSSSSEEESEGGLEEVHFDHGGEGEGEEDDLEVPGSERLEGRRSSRVKIERNSDEESIEEEEPLKILYRKQMEKLKIV